MNKQIIRLRLLKIVASIVVTLAVISCSKTDPQNINSYCGYYPGKTWKKMKNLKSAGWSSTKLKEPHQFANTLNMAAVMIVSHGKIVQKWGDVNRKIHSHSIRKSLLIEMFGPWVQKGVINLNATMADLGINDISPKLTREEQQATVKDLMEARSGIYHNAAFATKYMHKYQPSRGSHAPGTFWYYNNWDFNVVGYIYRKETGKDIFQSFYNMIAKPIGMKNFNPKTDGRYVYDRKMSKYPAYPFTISAMQLARFGLLMARDGRWKNKQIIPRFWVKRTTVSYSNTDDGSYPSSSSLAYARGYGYMWWIAVNGQHFKDVKGKMPFGLYTARGARGHMLAIIPDLHFVFVYRNDDSNGNRSTSSRDIGKLLKKVLEARTE